MKVSIEKVSKIFSYFFLFMVGVFVILVILGEDIRAALSQIETLIVPIIIATITGYLIISMGRGVIR